MQSTIAPFPETYSSLPLDLLLRAYSEGPGRVHAAAAGLTDEQLDARPIEGKWSIREVVLHTTESEILGTFRLRSVYAFPGVTLPMYDQDRWANEIDYSSASRHELADSLAVLTALRSYMSRLFRRMSPDAWNEKSGVHPDFGEVTMRNLLELYADHAEKHVEQILERRRLLGVPVDIALVLPFRL
jgi:hypothetical protein